MALNPRSSPGSRPLMWRAWRRSCPARRVAAGDLALGGTIPGARAACLGQRSYGVARHRLRGDGRAHGTRMLVGLTS
jgi:hypothetical protein